MIAPAIAGGQVDLIGGKKDLLGKFWQSLELSGLEISETAEGIRAKKVSDIIKAVDVKTDVYPGFATDLQAQFMALMCLADGNSLLEETLFENRFMHAPELMRMGAKIDVQGGIAKVEGVSKLKGAPVMATDLRASVSLILAGLAAEGETKVARVYHLDRGYESLVSKLSNVGANIQRISD
jgi:UDP-N-acetylglucosamine 1-carboxyvinyltransferase